MSTVGFCLHADGCIKSGMQADGLQRQHVEGLAYQGTAVSSWALHSSVWQLETAAPERRAGVCHT